MIGLDEMKGHLRVSHDEDDALIERLVASASAYLASVGVDVTSTPIPEPVRLAVILMVMSVYDRPEEAVPPTFDRLIAPYREVVL
ncbi:phage gp6-like head-tail connector protein [Cereibacter sphaeroides]|uniref:head-tail connector protein n=1 Tax=Cereibacter sphaeroides TaxID=1063 RepID=UPI000E5A5443|nr:head-tail connector protein [Cereibacter sphaeroides]RHZ91858.1 phage gp6-like head-tail connector protein [Cereibacter sphaeroides]